MIRFSHNPCTKEVDASDCWGIIQKLKCGGNQVLANGKTYSFIQEPVGEGRWYATREYSVLNCLAQAITLRAESDQGPIQSPFGLHNVSIYAEKLNSNHKTIVWNAPKPTKEANCGMENIVEGTGRMTLTKNIKDQNQHEMVRLVDEKKQIEILFHTEQSPICDTIKNAYTIMGLPDAHLVLGYPWMNAFIQPKPTSKFVKSMLTHVARKKRNVYMSVDSVLTARELENNRKKFSTSFAWGKIQLDSEPSWTLTWEKVYEEAFLTDVSQEMLRTQQPGQEFEYKIDQTIRIQADPFISDMCFITNNQNRLQMGPCGNMYETDGTMEWAFDYERKHLFAITNFLCLTANPVSNGYPIGRLIPGHAKATLSMQRCVASDAYQRWRIEYKNVDPEIVNVYPQFTLEEAEYIGEEMKDNEEAVSRKDAGDVLHWGQLKRNKADVKCLTVVNNTELTFDYCKTLEKGEYGQNDPNQMFEFLTDFTIRKFNTNYCFDTSETIVRLQPCRETSARFGGNLYHKQLIDITSFRCLEFENQTLRTGVCAKDQKTRTQKWIFSYRTPINLRTNKQTTLVPTQILALHKEFAINGNYFATTLPRIIIQDEDVKKPVTKPTSTVSTPASTTPTTVATTTTQTSTSKATTTSSTTVASTAAKQTSATTSASTMTTTPVTPVKTTPSSTSPTSANVASSTTKQTSTAAPTTTTITPTTSKTTEATKTTSTTMATTPTTTSATSKATLMSVATTTPVSTTKQTRPSTTTRATVTASREVTTSNSSTSSSTTLQTTPTTTPTSMIPTMSSVVLGTSTTLHQKESSVSIPAAP